MPFTLGQRWISDTESELGLGTVVAMDARTVTLLFSSTGENRLYARSDSPVTRVMFNPGDTITSHEGWQLHVDEVKEENGLLAYIGTRLDTEETGVMLREVLLDSKLVFSKPQDRLFAGQIDRMDRFALRYRARKFQSEQYRMPWSGLRGQRTSLIPHQLNIAHDVGRRHAPRVLLADEVGLGKTIEAGMILHQQLLSGAAERVLIIVPETLQHQWLVEMLRRFNLRFALFDDERYAEAQHDAYNPFETEQLVICSLDFARRSKQRLEHLCDAEWDLLIVDEAHGAHFGFHSYFPQNANIQGADVVIHSLHKTLPSLTQTALLHINGRYADRERIRNYLHMLQSSSPSYILMASIDECVRGMDECREEIMDTYVECLQQARERLKQLKNIKLIEAEHYDRSKIVLSVKNLKNTNGEVLNGKRFQEMLRSYHLEMEMASGSYVIAMTGPGDTQEGMDRLVQAVMEIDKNILCEELSGNDEDHTIKNISYEIVPLEQAYSSFEAGRMEGESVKWNEASGRISLEYVYLYPPGIPMIVPGERITSTIVQKMVKYKEMGFSIEGLSQENCLLVAGNPE